MPSFKSILVTAAIVVVTMAVVNRVDALRKVVEGGA